jgi:membrane-associated phospholipid phosphatase
MAYYPYVFHPITVLGASILVLIHHEWARQGADRSALRRRMAGFLAAGVLGLVPTVAYFAITGIDPIKASVGNSWRMDALVASGMFIAAAATWVAWRRFDWGSLVPGAMVTLAAVTVPYVALSPFWNVSGHVITSLMPTLYLTLVDRKFWPLLAIPVVMVPNRLYLGAHTWAQSVGGFLIAAAITLGLYWMQTGRSLRSEPESTTLVE